MVRKRSEDYRPMSVLPSIRSGQKAVTVHLKDSWTYARQQLFEKSQPVVEIPSFGKVYAVTKLRSVTAAVLYNVGLIDAQGMENIPRTALEAVAVRPTIGVLSRSSPSYWFSTYSRRDFISVYEVRKS